MRYHNKNFILSRKIKKQKKKQEKLIRLTGNYGCHSIDGCRGENTNEDTEIHFKENIKNIGDVEVYGVFDGHSGKMTSIELKKNAWSILKSKIIQVVKSYDDNAGIEEAFRLAQIDYLQLMTDLSGSTIVLTLIIKKNWETFNLCLGDARFYYVNKHTGENIVSKIHCLDFEDNTRETYFGKAYNRIHQINGPVREKKTNKYIPYDKFRILIHPKTKNIKKSPEMYNEYYFPDEYQWKEWVKWNENPKCNPTEFIVFPHMDSTHAWRMSSLQPSRSLGKTEIAIHMGVLYRIKIDPTKTIVCLCCDGVDDNDATNQDEFGKFIVNFEEANRKIFEKHRGLLSIMEKHPLSTLQIPPPNTSFQEKVQFIYNIIQDKKPLSVIDKDYKYGVNQAINYFNTYPEEILGKSSSERARRTAYLCSLRMSSDNVTIIVVTFE